MKVIRGWLPSTVRQKPALRAFILIKIEDGTKRFGRTVRIN